MQAQEPTLFFSYARADAELALKLATDLRSAGINLWMDQLDIQAGDRWDRAVEEALTTCPCLLVILTPTSVASNNVMDEVSMALEENKRVVPVLFGDCEIPLRLRRLQYIDFTVGYDAAFPKLLKALAVYASKAVQPLEAAVPSPSELQEVEEAAAAGAAARGPWQGKATQERPSIRLSSKPVLVAASLALVVLAAALIANWDPGSSREAGQQAIQTAQRPPQPQKAVNKSNDASDVKLLNREGYKLFRAKRYDEAVSTLARAVNLQPDHRLANLNLAKALCAAERLPEAAEVMKKGLNLNPELRSTAFGDGEFNRVCKDIMKNLDPARAE